MAELESELFIQRVRNQRRKYGEFGVNEYVICDPRTGEPLEAQAGRTLLFSNKIPYFTIPVCFIKELSARWSLAKLGSSQTVLYVSLLWVANKNRSHEFAISHSELRRLSGLSRAPFKTALAQLQTLGLVSQNSRAEDTFILCDPYTGEPLHEATVDPQDDPANYFVKEEDGREKRFNLNTGNARQQENLIRSCLPASARIISRSDVELMVTCPFHSDDSPSCSINLEKRIFHCFSCEQSGTIKQFVMRIAGIAEGEVIRRLGEADGKELQFRDPDKSYEAIYSYRDKNGKLVKQVLRTPEKTFPQRRPAKGGGWIYDIKGVKPLLYNLELLEFSGMVCICEGEKDCDTMNRLALSDARGAGGDVVATTSGGADTWTDSLADDLRGKCVVLLPDDDEPGQRF